MLTPEYIDSIGEELLGLYDELENSIVEDISRRIVKTGYVTDTAKWQLKQAQYSGMLLDDITEQIASVTKYSEKEVKELFMNAGVECIKVESAYVEAAGKKVVSLADSGAMKQILNVNVKKVNQTVGNLTGTTATTAQQTYINATNLAYMQTTSGAFSYQEAIKRAIKSAAIEGATVSYPTGHVSKLDTAVRRSVVTGVNQTAGKLTEKYADECDCDYYEVSAHYGARLSHAYWQGKVYKIHGKAHGYPNFEESTGYGSGDGLCGWNCRHSFHMYWPGLSKRAYSTSQINKYNKKTVKYNGVEMTEYEASQTARKMERGIREDKRVLVGYNAAIQASDDVDLTDILKNDFEAESVRLKAHEAELRNFCNQTGRAYETARTQVHAVKDESGRIIHFDKSTSQKAVWANRKSHMVATDLIGVETGKGTKIAGLSYHLEERCAERGLAMSSVMDALTNPLHIANIKTDTDGRRSQNYVGKLVTVSVNPDTGVIASSWRTHTKTRKKYGGDT